MFDLIITHLSNPTLVYVLIGVIFSTSTTATIGSFCLLQKKALAGDAVAHALLPGLCVGFLCTGTKAPFYLTLGACTTGAMTLFLIDYLPTHSKIKKDTATALALSAFFGIGLLLLTHIQQSGNANQAGLRSFLFGQAATLVSQDIIIFIVLASLLISITALFFKEFRLVSFDPVFTHTIGWPVGLLNLLLQCLTILTIIVGIRSTGMVLVAAVLIVPAAAARFWTNRLAIILVLAALFAAIASAVGTLLSYAIAGLPTGPCIVLSIAILAILSFFIAPEKGLLPRKYKQYKYQQKVLIENVLKLFYELGGEDSDYYVARKTTTLLAKCSMRPSILKKALKKLLTKGFVIKKSNDLWALTPKGKAKGAHILDLHKLWEAYLVHYLKIQRNHVHDDAESIEHLITPEIEADLRRLLDEAT